MGNNGRVQAALSVVNAGGVVNGPEFVNSPANLAVIPVPTGAINLPRGSAAPGNVNINIASDSITLAPGNYVVANLNVNYMGTWNGWLSVPCTPFNQLPSELQRFPYIGGGQGVIPGYLNGGINEYGTMPGIHTADANGLKFGQVETTVVNIAPSTPNQPAEDDFCFNLQPGFCSSAHSTPNTFSVQLNTNPFLATTGPANFLFGAAAHPGWVAGDQGWVQFTLQSAGSAKTFSVCVWQIDFTQGKQFTLAANNAYTPQCLQTNGIQKFSAQGRDLKPLDSASVAGSAFVDQNGTDHDLGIVAQLSWWDPTLAPNNFRGLYATVAPDLSGSGNPGTGRPQAAR